MNKTITKLKLLTVIFFLLFLSNTYAQVTANAGSDKSGCALDTLKATGSGLSSGDTGSYSWRNIKTNTIVSNTNKLYLSIKTADIISFELKVTKTSKGNTYIDLDTFVYTCYALPTFTYSGFTILCFNDGNTNLTQMKMALVQTVPGYQAPVRKDSIRYYQNRNPSYISGGPIGVNDYNYNYSKYISNATVPKLGYIDTICYDYTNAKGCYNKECKGFRIYPNPVVDIKDGIYCQKNGLIFLNNLAIKPFVKTGGIQTFRCINVPAGSGANPNTIVTENTSFNPSKWELNPGTLQQTQGNYAIGYCFKNPTTGCQTCDTAIVTVTNPAIKFSIIPNECLNNSLLALDSLVKDAKTGARLPNGNWKAIEYNGSRDRTNSIVKNALDNSVISKHQFNPKTGSGNYLLKFTDTSSGCIAADSTAITINGLPKVMISYDSVVCSNQDTVRLMSNYPYNDPNGKWIADNTSTFGEYNTNNINFGTGYRIFRKIKYTYKNPQTTCSDTVTGQISILKKPKFKIKTAIQWGSKYKVNFNMDSLNIDTNLINCQWDFGNGKTSTLKAPKDIVYTDSGKYKVKLYITYKNNLCISTDSSFITLNSKITSIESALLNPLLFPNPVTEYLTVNSPINAQIKIFENTGRLILTRVVNENVDTRLDLRHLNSGVYVVLFQTDKGNKWLKVIKN